MLRPWEQHKPSPKREIPTNQSYLLHKTSPLYGIKILTQHDLSFATRPEHILDMEHSVHLPPFCWEHPDKFSKGGEEAGQDLNF